LEHVTPDVPDGLRSAAMRAGRPDGPLG